MEHLLARVRANPEASWSNDAMAQVANTTTPAAYRKAQKQSG
jgi:hypothetical protein